MKEKLSVAVSENLRMFSSEFDSRLVQTAAYVRYMTEPEPTLQHTWRRRGGRQPCRAARAIDPEDAASVREDAAGATKLGERPGPA